MGFMAGSNIDQTLEREPVGCHREFEMFNQCEAAALATTELIVE
jgi:hypothetical protein